MQKEAERLRRVQSNCEDVCLIAEFLNGSEAAFEELFRKYQSRLFSVCRHFLGSHAEAEDTVQDAFVQIYSSLKRFRGESSFHTWAYGITVRTCISRMRKLKRHAESTGEWAELPSAEGNPDVERILIQQTISRLPDSHRIVLILRYYEQLSIEEAAQVLQCGADQMKMRLHRARNAMKELLTQPTGGER